jgi:cobaltochelatase CobT
MALRLACHNKTYTGGLLPARLRERHRAVEQARVEAIGSRRMLGVAGNLDAMLDDRFQRARYADIAVRAEAPLERSR